LEWLLKDLSSYGTAVPWKPLEAFGNVWNLRKHLETFGHFLETVGNLWKHLETFGKETFGHLDFSRFLDIPRW